MRLSAEQRRARRALFALSALALALWLFSGSAADGLTWCPSRRLLGIDCPGCGMTRALIALGGGRALDALSYHPMVAWFAAGAAAWALASAARLFSIGRAVALWESAPADRARSLYWGASLLGLCALGVARWFGVMAPGGH